MPVYLLSLLTGIMEKQMNQIKNGQNMNKNSQQEMLNQYQDVMKKMGMPNLNLSAINSMINTQYNKNLSQNNTLKKKKIKHIKKK